MSKLPNKKYKSYILALLFVVCVPTFSLAMAIISTPLHHAYAQGGAQGTFTGGGATNPSAAAGAVPGGAPPGGAAGAAAGGAAGSTSFFGANDGGFTCGSGTQAVKTRFDFGCKHEAQNPIYDFIFAMIRFLTFGVGVVITIAIIMSGIQYTTSEGNPEKTMAAKNHIQNAIIGLMMYIFAFALLNYLIPGGLIS